MDAHDVMHFEPPSARATPTSAPIPLQRGPPDDLPAAAGYVVPCPIGLFSGALGYRELPPDAATGRYGVLSFERPVRSDNLSDSARNRMSEPAPGPSAAHRQCEPGRDDGRLQSVDPRALPRL